MMARAPRPIFTGETSDKRKEQKFIEKYDRLRSTFPEASNTNDYLLQAEDDVNSKTGEPDSRGGKRSYFRGGVRSLKNVCSFRAPNLDSISGYTVPNKINLYLSPNDVSWEYTLRTNVIDTYGGQVIQILGVSIENLTIRGFFGSEGMWGFNKTANGGFGNSRYEDFPQGYRPEGSEITYSLSETQGYKKWVDGQMRSGMVQFAEWFKSYFYYITQAGNFDKNNMVFEYPHLNWYWNIRPLDFPQIRFANDELMPQWELKCDFIEDLQNTFQQEVTGIAKKMLSRFRDGVGFSEFIEWSEPVYTSQETRTQAARDIAVKYSDFIGGNFTEKELETLITRGFSYQVGNLTPYSGPNGSRVPPTEGNGGERNPPNIEGTE
jgi:hypothetical protein